MSAIDNFLSQLNKSVPGHLKEDILAETRSHLEALALEHQQQGLPRAQAEALAVEKFGSPRKISRSWRQVVGVVEWPDVLLAALPVLGITGLGWQFVGQHISLATYLIIFGMGALAAWRRNWPAWWFAWLGWLMLALLVVNGTAWLFMLVFPVVVTLLAVESWQHASLMTLPFTTYVAFATLIEHQQLATTGWGPGSVYPGNVIWLETAFSLLWIIILIAGLRATRPSRRATYLLAGMLGTQLIYGAGLVFMVLVARLLPDYFITTLTPHEILLEKLPIVLITVGLTLYPPLVWLVSYWVRKQQPQSKLLA